MYQYVLLVGHGAVLTSSVKVSASVYYAHRNMSWFCKESVEIVFVCV